YTASSATRATKCSRSSADECGASGSRSCPVTASPWASRLTILSEASSPSAHASHNELKPHTTHRQPSRRRRRQGGLSTSTASPAGHPARPQIPALEPTLCETAAIPFPRLGLDPRLLAPTRELAVQIEDEIHGLSYHTPITSAPVYGGVEMAAQERALKAGVDIIVATPGRLIDHMRQQNADLSAIELLVLDEADRMMDMGFWPDVRRIISALPAKRQTLLFSATMPDDVVRSALEIVREPKFVQVGQRSAPAKTITHTKQEVSHGHKADWLIEHLRKPEGPVLIFSRTKIGADKLARKLQSA